VFEDHPDVAEPRERLWEVIEETPWLRWQLLTKRPENIASMAPWSGPWPEHVWIGTSVENQRFANERIPLLLKVPAAVRFLSCEPLLGPVDLRLTGTAPSLLRDGEFITWHRKIAWVICGGESGPKARETDLRWMSSIVEQCRDAEVAPFVKQLGTAWAKDIFVGGRSLYAAGDRKGGDPQFWPADLRVREFPTTASADVPGPGKTSVGVAP
jgi:protein gp37